MVGVLFIPSSKPQIPIFVHLAAFWKYLFLQLLFSLFLTSLHSLKVIFIYKLKHTYVQTCIYLLLLLPVTFNYMHSYLYISLVAFICKRRILFIIINAILTKFRCCRRSGSDSSHWWVGGIKGNNNLNVKTHYVVMSCMYVWVYIRVEQYIFLIRDYYGLNKIKCLIKKFIYIKKIKKKKSFQHLIKTTSFLEKEKINNNNKRQIKKKILT